MRNSWVAGSFAVVFGLVLLCILPYLLTLVGYDAGFPVDPTGQLVLEDSLESFIFPTGSPSIKCESTCQ
jgi:hypothetical protein